MKTEILGNLCNIIIGKTPSRSSTEYWGKGNKWVSISDLKSKIINNTKEEITDHAVKDARCRLIPKGTLLFSFKLSIGKMAFAGCDLYTNEAIVGLIPKDTTIINPEFLYYALRIVKFEGSNQAVMGQTLNSKSLNAIQIPLPPLDDQIRISHLLGKVEAMIARRKQHLQQLDELLKSVFLEMFGDPVRNEKGWETMILPQLVLPEKNSLKRGPFGGALKKEIFVESGFLVYEQNHALNGDYSFERYFITEKKYKELIDFKVEPNDILISCSGVYLGKLSIVPLNAKPGIINQALLKISLNPKIIRHIFFINVFGSPQFKNKYFPSNRGGAIPNLPPMTDMKKIPFISPPIELQNQFATIVEKVESLKSRYQSSLSNLENLYGALSQKAFKGELDLGRVPLLVEEEAEKTEEVPVLPFDDGLSEVAKKALVDLNKFNNSSASLRALQEAALINLDSPAMKAAQMLVEQARLWKNPLDELKNMPSISRAMAELSKPSAMILAVEKMEAFQNTSKLAQRLAASIPKINMSFIEQQRKLIDSASRPFIEMQKTLANLNLARTTLSGVLDDSEAVARRFQASIPDFASWQQQYSSPEDIDAETEEEEPKHIFTRYDITDALAETEGLTFEELSVKLIELESIELSSYERIRSILFELLGEGVLTQQFDKASQSLKLRLIE